MQDLTWGMRKKNDVSTEYALFDPPQEPNHIQTASSKEQPPPQYLRQKTPESSFLQMLMFLVGRFCFVDQVPT